MTRAGPALRPAARPAARISAVRAGAISTTRPSGARRRRPAAAPDRGRRRRRGSASAPASSSPTQRSRQAVARSDELADRKGIEELVGDDEQRRLAGASARSRARRRGRAPASVALLDAARSGAGLDQVESARCRNAGSSRGQARSMSAISVPRPGPISTSVTRRRPAERAPGLRPARRRSARRTSG